MPRPPAESDAVEVTELVDFLSEQPPFDALPEALRRYAARHMEITYARKGTVVLEMDASNDRLYLVRTGAVELHDEKDTLVERLGEGEFFGYPLLLTESPAERRATTIEDTLLYLFPKAVCDRLRSESEPFDRFFNRAHAERIEAALRERRQNNAALTTTIRSLLRRPPVSAPPDCSVQEAARRMTDAKVSSLLIQDDGRLLGIVTDRDLRRRVISQDLALDTPVSSIMTGDPITIGADQYAFEALLLMSQHNVHHLPVLDGRDLAGMVTTTDLMRLQADNPVYLVGEALKQPDVEGLAQVSHRIPQMVIHLVEADARADDTTRLVTAVTDAITGASWSLLKTALEHLRSPMPGWLWAHRPAASSRCTPTRTMPSFSPPRPISTSTTPTSNPLPGSSLTALQPAATRTAPAK